MGLRPFLLAFPYLEESDVVVKLDGVTQTQPTEYLFANATTINFISAPANGAEIIIERVTDTEDIKSVFFPGSSIGPGI